MTRMQYKNCAMPVNMMNTRNASMSFRRGEVVSLYAFRRDCSALPAAAGAGSGAAVGGTAAGCFVAAADLGAMAGERVCEAVDV